MSPYRMLAAGALLVIGAVLVSVPACIVANDFENGQDCLRDEECASKQCTAGKCIGPNGGVTPPPVTDSAPKVDTAAGSDGASDASEAGTDASDAAEAATDTEDAAATDTADGASSG